MTTNNDEREAAYLEWTLSPDFRLYNKHGFDAGWQAARQPAAATGQAPAPSCKGMNCGAKDGASHSLECQAEHALAVSGFTSGKAIGYLVIHVDFVDNPKLWRVVELQFFDSYKGNENYLVYPLRLANADPIAEEEEEEDRIVGWSYEIATARSTETGEYCNWEKRLSEYRPHAPDASIRNLHAAVVRVAGAPIADNRAKTGGYVTMDEAFRSAASQPAESKRVMTDEEIRQIASHFDTKTELPAKFVTADAVKFARAILAASEGCDRNAVIEACANTALNASLDAIWSDGRLMDPREVGSACAAAIRALRQPEGS
jgi:hypothetical protein